MPALVVPLAVTLLTSSPALSARMPASYTFSVPSYTVSAPVYEELNMAEVIREHVQKPAVPLVVTVPVTPEAPKSFAVADNNKKISQPSEIKPKIEMVKEFVMQPLAGASKITPTAVADKPRPAISALESIAQGVMVPAESLPVILPQKAELGAIIDESPLRVSPNTKRLLDKLPPVLSSISVANTVKPFEIERVQVPNLNVSAQEVREHEAMGISIQVRKPSIEVQDYLGKAYDLMAAKQYEGAIAYYEAILEAQPKHVEAMVGRASALHHMGDIAKARAVYENVLKYDPENQTVWRNLMVLVSQESPTQALTQLQDLQSRNPNFAPIPAQMAILMNDAGKREEAIEAMSMAIKLDNENLTYWQHLASFLDAAGMRLEAIKSYKHLSNLMRQQNSPAQERAAIQERLTFLLSNQS